MGVSELLESRKICLWIIGVWPEECRRSPTFTRLKLHFVLCVHLLLCALQIVGILSFATLENIPEYLTDLLSYMACTAKLVPIISYKSKVMKLISDTVILEQLSKAGDVKQLEVTEFWQSCRDTIMKYHTSVYILSFVVYNITPLFSAGKVLPLKLIFRSDILNSPWYEIVYSIECFVIGIAVCNIIACELFYTIFICKLCEELQLIKLLLKDSAEGHCSETLQLVIKRHAKILKYGEEMCQVMSSAFFLQYSFVTVLLCFTAFTVLTTQNSATANKTIMIASMTITFQCVICMAGELVTTRSEILADALVQSDLCSSGYDELQPRQLQQLVLVLLRAQKPLRLSVGTFGIINLQFFSRTMKGAFSFFMLLRTVYI